MVPGAVGAVGRPANSLVLFLKDLINSRVANIKGSRTNVGTRVFIFLSFRSVRNSMTDADHSAEPPDEAVRTAFAWILPFLSSVDCRNVPVVSKGWNTAFSKSCKAALSERRGPAERNLVRWILRDLCSRISEMGDKPRRSSYEYPSTCITTLRRGDVVFFPRSIGYRPRDTLTFTLHGGTRRNQYKLEMGGREHSVSTEDISRGFLPLDFEIEVYTFLGKAVTHHYGDFFETHYRFKRGACTIPFLRVGIYDDDQRIWGSLTRCYKPSDLDISDYPSLGKHRVGLLWTSRPELRTIRSRIRECMQDVRDSFVRFFENQNK